MIALLDIARGVAWTLALSSGTSEAARQNQVLPAHAIKAGESHFERLGLNNKIRA